ncbi:uncharacterized protein LOC126872673 [Bombus huntii]|uniref:uncharacterized protein LOC126872673 n=1 Tax=Bombus huntii TaxID=85661 RepID=UPI0021AA19A6|nr:uncharacterized protein LOC126872673 [Bombus huntii]
MLTMAEEVLEEVDSVVATVVAAEEVDSVESNTMLLVTAYLPASEAVGTVEAEMDTVPVVVTIRTQVAVIVVAVMVVAAMAVVSQAITRKSNSDRRVNVVFPIGRFDRFPTS